MRKRVYKLTFMRLSSGTNSVYQKKPKKKERKVWSHTYFTCMTSGRCKLDMKERGLATKQRTVLFVPALCDPDVSVIESVLVSTG